MEQAQIDMLNDLQQVLRGLTASIAAAARCDPMELATMLQAFAAQPDLSPIATHMLNDLAQGLTVISGRRPQ